VTAPPPPPPTRPPTRPPTWPFRRRAGRVLAWLAGGLAAFGLVAVALAVVLDRAFPPDLRRLASVSTEVDDRQGDLLAAFPAPGGVWRLRTRVADVSPAFLALLIQTEDRLFWQHPGVVPWSLARAALQWVSAGRIVSGGSTLTMQTARLLHRGPRSVAGKLIEIARAVQLEAHFSKSRILGMWLTLAPFGGNIEGVRAASLAWFGIPASQLTASQAALLVAIPRRPEALRPDRHAAAAARLRDRLWPAAAGQPVPTRRVALPAHADAALAPLSRAPDHPARIATTLDGPLQRALERVAAQALAGLPPAASLALLVVDPADGAIRAIVPGAGRLGQAGTAPERAGMLDLTRAVRSPGSALKPLLYGMAFQQGLVRPDTPIADLPHQFGAYAPEDYDRAHAGLVTAAAALQRSLNVPAVLLLNRLGPLRFHAWMQAAGAGLVLPRDTAPSLPLALGGAGITLRRLAGLYAGLATDGAARAPFLLASDARANRPMLQPQDAGLVAAILTRPFPDGGRDGVAWKTGTSWGGRDAWALGFDRTHLAGVWIGRPDGTPLPGATGTRLALPLLSRVFDLLAPSPRPRAPVVAPPATAAADTLRLLFPPPGAELDAQGPVPLRASGGRRPLTFLVDGAPLPADAARRQADWLPDSPGFYTLSVLDADGTAARASVRVK
jgi:penicillin-binding protein 1C